MWYLNYLNKGEHNKDELLCNAIETTLLIDQLEENSFVLKRTVTYYEIRMLLHYFVIERSVIRIKVNNLFNKI